MKFNKGVSFLISFIINGAAALSSATFTGKSITIQGTKMYLVKLASGKDYAFTQQQLDEFAPLNDPSLQEEHDSITLGQCIGDLFPFLQVNKQLKGCGGLVYCTLIVLFGLICTHTANIMCVCDTYIDFR